MRDAAIVSLLSLIPQRAASRAVGRLARVPSRWLARAFVRAYDVDLSEAETADPPSLDALFTRRLRPGARPIDPAPDALVSPVDGTLAWRGATDGTVPVGPVRFALRDVVGRGRALRAAAILYLSPRDYHRVHAPVDGRVTAASYVPGSLWPVFPGAVARVPRLFARNERLVLELETPWGPGVIVLIGAFGVGRIRSPLVDVPRREARRALRAEVARGDEIGVFHLGSTVMVGLPRVPRAWAAEPGAPVTMGSALARM